MWLNVWCLGYWDTFEMILSGTRSILTVSRLSLELMTTCTLEDAEIRNIGVRNTKSSFVSLLNGIGMLPMSSNLLRLTKKLLIRKMSNIWNSYSSRDSSLKRSVNKPSKLGKIEGTLIRR